MTDMQTLGAGGVGRLPRFIEASGRRMAAFGLVVLMALGAFSLWTAVPLGVLWLAAQLQDPAAALQVVPVLVVAGGVPIAMALGVQGLARLERRYHRVAPPPRIPAYRRSISDSRPVAPANALDTIMVASVLAALIALACRLLGAL